MSKWFSFNQKTQRTEEVTPSEELFQSSPLLFWSRGMNEWVFGPKALQFFLTPPAPVATPAVVEVVEEEKKQRMGPFYKNDTAKPAVVADPAEVKKQGPIKPLQKKKVKKHLKKKLSKHINLAMKKKKSKKKAVKLKKKKNRRNKRN